MEHQGTRISKCAVHASFSPVAIMEGQWVGMAREEATAFKTLALGAAFMSPVEALRRQVEPEPSATAGLRKVAYMLEFVEVCLQGPPHMQQGTCSKGILEIVDRFAVGPGQWLKVAGDCKSAIVDKFLGCKASLKGHALVEFGAFVGYTAVRLAGRSLGQCPTVSLEVVPLHSSVARRLLALASSPSSAEVWTGQARDLQPRMLECFGAACVDFAFLDHRGTRFHTELAQNEGLGSRRPTACFVADNSLKPGAPMLAWQGAARQKASCQAWAMSAWALAEYMADALEDWMIAGGTWITF